MKPNQPTKPTQFCAPRDGSAVKLTVLACLGVFLALAACQSDAEAPEPAAPRPVRTAVAMAAGETVQTAIAGVTQASTESKLSFRVNGTVERVAVTVGSPVQRGDLIARLDPADLEIGAGQAAASLAQVEAMKRQARADFDRVRDLYENNNASKSDLDAARAASESANAQVDAAQKSLEQSRRQVGYSTLSAPASGAIVSMEVEENETVSAGQTIVILESGARPEVILAVSEVNIPLISVGDKVNVVIDAVGGERLAGTVIEVGVAATPGSTTFPAVVRLDDVPSSVRSGMAAEVFLALANDARGVVIPRVAVGEDGAGRFVFVLEENGGQAVVRRRDVSVGEPMPSGIAVTEGLEAGERVVTAGVRRLTDGMTVRATAEAAG